MSCRNKKALNHNELGLLNFIVGEVVEPQRIELWSREDDTVLSTCLVDFDCREKVLLRKASADKQGRQQPKPLLSYCVLAALSNIARSSSALRHHYTSAGRTWALSDDGLPDLIGDKLTQRYVRLSSHGVVRLAKYVIGLSFKALIP